MLKHVQLLKQRLRLRPTFRAEALTTAEAEVATEADFDSTEAEISRPASSVGILLFEA